MKKCIIFGASEAGIRACELLSKDYQIVAYSDNNTDKWNTCFGGVQVISPNEIDTYDDVLVIIASMYYAEINKQLVEMNIVPKVFVKNGKDKYQLYEIEVDKKLFEDCEYDDEKAHLISKDYSINYVDESNVNDNSMDVTKSNEIEDETYSRKKVLVCAYAFPPIGGSGVQRVLNMIYELYNNNRTIGADDVSIGNKVKKLYATFCKGEIIVTDIRTAEMTKVVENTFRAVNIAFANELAKICRHDDMDVYEIIRICNMHPRVNILQPGPGVGGHCISVDPWYLVGDYPRLAKVIDESMKTNDAMPDFVLNRIYEIMNKNGITDVGRVGLYGLTYKENVDDCRESPTLQMIDSMKKHLCGDLVKVYDPFISEDIVSNQLHNLDEFIKEVDLVVLMVGHDEIKDNMDKLKDKIILDTRHICFMDGVYRL